MCVFFFWGCLDVVSIPKTNENFRLLYDTKGRFRLHSIKDEEAKVGWCLCYVLVQFRKYCSVCVLIVISMIQKSRFINTVVG